MLCLPQDEGKAQGATVADRVVGGVGMLVTIVVVLVLVACLICAMLCVFGPQIGNVFSRITSGLLRAG